MSDGVPHPRIVLVAAMDRQRVIGRGSALPWHLPDELRRFKAVTMGRPLLMGRRTAESLGRALPGRRNLVLTRSGRAPFAGMEAVASIADALARVRATEADTLCVIGGAEVYALALPFADAMALTLVDAAVEGGDTFFPVFDPADWQETGRTLHPADARHAHGYACVDFERRQQGGRN